MVRRSAVWLARIAAAAALPLLPLAGCAGVGPQRLDMDHMGYASALGEGLKRQMLLNMVRMRHSDVPAFLTVSQLISGYTLQSTGQAGLNAYPNSAAGNLATISGTLQYTTRPTFTFTPVTGDRFAQSYLRPLAPAELLSLARSGAPIDLLLRIGVQSVNRLANTASGGGPQHGASDRFQALVDAVREVELAGAVSLHFERRPAGGGGGGGGAGAVRVHLLLHAGDPRGRAAERRFRELLGLAPEVREFEVVYGRTPGGPRQIAMLTRSVLQILSELGADIDTPETLAGVGADADPRERLLHVRQGERAPPDAYAAVQYRDRWFWIDAGDQRSKAAFAFTYVLQILAESGPAQPTPIVTIPAQ